MDVRDSIRGPLVRTRDGYVAGICDGLGRYFDVNPTLLRVGWLVAVVFFGTGLLAYLALWWLMPREDQRVIEPSQWRRNASSGRYSPPLERTSQDRKIFGVCGGIARAWQIDPVFVRLGVLSLTMVSGGMVIIAYLIAAIVMPNPRGSFPTRAHPVEF